MPHASLTRITLRWVFTLASLFVVGPIASRMTATLRAADGSIHTSLLVSDAPVTGALIALGVFALTGLIALPAARIFGPRFAMRMACFCIAWASWTTGTTDEIIRSLRGTSPMTTLALEGALVLVLSLALILAILRFGKVQDHGPDGRDIRGGHDVLSRSLAGMRQPRAIASLLASIALGGLVAWVFAIEPNKGQAVFAAFMGGIAAGAGAHLASLALPGENDAPPVLAPFLGMLILAVASPLAASALLANGTTLLEAVYAERLFALAHVLPLDFAAGALLGVPIGLAWARSMAEDGESETRAEAKSA